MLYYKVNIIELLKSAGFNTNRIRKEKLLNEAALQYIREGKMIGPVPLNSICALLKKQPGELIGWKEDTEEATL